MFETSNRTEVRLEGIDQVKLQAIEPRFALARSQVERLGRVADLQVRRQRCVLEEWIKRAAMPPGKRRSGVWSNAPQSVNTMLQHVCRCPLVTFTPRCDRRILLFPLERVSHLEVVLPLLLANAEVSEVSMRLLAERRIRLGRGSHTRSGVVIRVSRSVQVVFVFQQQVYGQTGPPGLELVIQDQVGIEEVREEMCIGARLDVSGVRHTIGSEGTSAHERGCSRLRSASPTLNCRATRAFAGSGSRYYNRNRGRGSADGD